MDNNYEELSEVYESLPKEEQQLEDLWQNQKGIDPVTKKYWFTPRMKRNIERNRIIDTKSIDNATD